MENAEKQTQFPKAVVVDLGKQSRKRVKKLRNGEGPLLSDVESTIAQLREDGVIAAGAQAVIVVVERKLDLSMPFPLRLPRG